MWEFHRLGSKVTHEGIQMFQRHEADVYFWTAKPPVEVPSLPRLSLSIQGNTSYNLT